MVDLEDEFSPDRKNNLCKLCCRIIYGCKSLTFSIQYLEVCVICLNYRILFSLLVLRFYIFLSPFSKQSCFAFIHVSESLISFSPFSSLSLRFYFSPLSFVPLYLYNVFCCLTLFVFIRIISIFYFLNLSSSFNLFSRLSLLLARFISNTSLPPGRVWYISEVLMDSRQSALLSRHGALDQTQSF